MNWMPGTDQNPKVYLMSDTVDGWNPVNSPVEVGSLSHYVQGFSTIPGGWFGISAINSNPGNLRFLEIQKKRYQVHVCPRSLGRVVVVGKPFELAKKGVSN